jgi:2,4-dienoyl-CoA reductase-like NADH-dependent reductase (Old Yellow Enzyme family)
MSLDALFQPFRLKGFELRNRFVMAPMTRSFAPDGVPGSAVAAYYRRRAEGEVGLILSEGTVIQRPVSRNERGIPFFHGEIPLAGWQTVIDEVHNAGGRMGPQIWHVGALVPGRDGYVPEGPIDSPSGFAAPGKPAGEPMTEEAIADTVAAFGQAAADARRLGFDIVELHGAHGYLLDQFFWDGTNRREDRWGGATIGERSRFASEAVRAVRAAVGPDFPVILRISQWKQQDFGARLAQSPAEMEAWLAPLVEAGVNILHCSQRRFWEPEYPEIDGIDGLNFAGWAKKVTGAPTITVGSVGLASDFLTMFSGEGSSPAGLDRLAQRFERGEFDLVAVGRALLSDPDWVRKVRDGRQDELRGFDVRHLGELT